MLVSRPPKKFVRKETLTSLRAKNTELIRKVTKLEKTMAKLEEQQMPKKKEIEQQWWTE